MKKTVFSLCAVLAWAMTYSQSTWNYSLDLEKISKCIAITKEHGGSFRGVTTKLPERRYGGEFNLTRHIYDPTPGESGAYHTVNISNENETFIYQKGDSLLLTVQTTDYQEASQGSYYGTAVLAVKGKVVLVTSWAKGRTMGNLIYIHRWNSKEYVHTNLEGTILKKIPAGEPHAISLTALRIMEADMNLALGEPLDSSPLVNQKVYKMVDKEYASKFHHGNGDDLRIVQEVNGENFLMSVDGATRQWKILSVKFLQQPMITENNATGLRSYSNPNFNSARDIVRTEVTDRAQKLAILDKF